MTWSFLDRETETGRKSPKVEVSVRMEQEELGSQVRALDKEQRWKDGADIPTDSSGSSFSVFTSFYFS